MLGIIVFLISHINYLFLNFAVNTHYGNEHYFIFEDKEHKSYFDVFDHSRFINRKQKNRQDPLTVEYQELVSQFMHVMNECDILNTETTTVYIYFKNRTPYMIHNPRCAWYKMSLCHQDFLMKLVLLICDKSIITVINTRIKINTQIHTDTKSSFFSGYIRHIHYSIAQNAISRKSEALRPQSLTNLLIIVYVLNLRRTSYGIYHFIQISRISSSDKMAQSNLVNIEKLQFPLYLGTNENKSQKEYVKISREMIHEAICKGMYLQTTHKINSDISIIREKNRFHLKKYIVSAFKHPYELKKSIIFVMMRLLIRKTYHIKFSEVNLRNKSGK